MYGGSETMTGIEVEYMGEGGVWERGGGNEKGGRRW